MDLTVETREKFGKACKTVRKAGFIPAVLYGHGVQNLHLAVKARDFEKAYREAGVNTILNLVFRDEKRSALVHEIQRNFLSDEITHVDFYQIRMDEKINVLIPIEFNGESPAVKEMGGVVEKLVSEIEVEVLPGNLPRSFGVDLALLDDIGKSFYVKDLVVPADVRVLADLGAVVATVTAPVEEKIEEPVAVADVKVETEEKKAERDAGKTESKLNEE